MAATGGGKIRSRRYHIASKPYAKGKQQPGLITRVTDTVKSIVPSWLQKYFKNGEVAEGDGAAVGIERNNVAPPPNGNDEAVPLPDGRDSPEPSTSNTEPSTSKASLNFQEALSRPPLNRTHLHFPSLDGSPAFGGASALFSQPSTSAAPYSGSPFAVTSNFSLVKEIKDSCSQHEDDNISTTSGFSSRASDKDVPTSKTVPLLWSPESERTHSGSQPAHSGLKRPAFNLSVFGTSSSSVLNSSVLNSSQLGDSPFYPGKTTYGGAAAMRTARSRPATPYQPPVRRQIKAKPAGAQPCGVTSATARRILQSLERMSSPLADAKRIPSTISSPLSASLNHTDLDISNYQAKRKRLEPSAPPVQKLVVPAAAAVSGNRSMSFRPSLTPGGGNRGLDKNNRDTPVRQSPPISDPSQTPSTSSMSYPLSSTPAPSSAASGGGKMKRERAIRPSSKRPEDELAEDPDLPPASLPSNFTLPTFNFSSPPPSSSFTSGTTPLATVSEEPLANKEPVTPSTPPSVPFTFSSPIVKATAASPPTFSPSAGFTFSAPTLKTGPSYSNGKIVPTVVPVKSVASEENEFEGPFKPAKVLKQGSVLDILKGPGFASPSQNSADKPSQSASLSSATFSGFGDKFRPPAGSWSCDTCLLQNKSSDKKCVACFATQPNTDSASKSDSKPAEAPASISSLFALPAGSWECDTCLVNNKPEVVKCVACDTAKPGTGVKSRLTLPVLSETSSTLSTTTTTAASSTATGLLGFGDKFKKPEGAWDCDVCMVRNKAQDVKCVSCLSSKPGAVAAVVSTPVSATSAASALGFGDKFKKPEGSWECEVCCVQNKAADQQCVACQSAKPGAKIESKGFCSSFGVQSNCTDSSSSGFKFGTGSTDSTSAGLKFGGSFSDSSTAGGFKFGIGTSDSTSKSEGFKFGGSFTDAGSGGVKLGSASSESTATKESSTRAFDFTGSMDDDISGKKTKSEDSSTGFKFGGGSGITFSSQASGSENSAFLFGAKPSEKESSNSSFSFSAPQSKAEKDAPAFSETASTTTTSSTATTAANAIPVFGKSLVAESSASKFVEQATKEQTLVTPNFTFGKPEEKKDTSAPSKAFMFGASKEAEKPTANLGFSFSEPDPPKDFPKPTLTFGKTAESTEPPKPSFGFGQSITDTSAPTPNFGFMANSSSTPASSSSTPSLFITPTTSSLAPSPAPSNTFVFGQSSSSELTMAKTFVFGQQDSQTPAPAAPSAAPAPAQPFQFGSGSNASGPSFNFGAVASSTPASAAPAPSANPSPFVFSSAAPSSGFGTGQAPIFGQNASQPSALAFGSSAPSFSANASPASAFGAKSNSAPVFGQQANPTPTFGSTAASTGQGGFQFGSTGGFGASGSNSNVFGFGGAAAPATPAASPAMPALNPPGGGFSFGQTPAFNIGSGKSPFTPTPSGQNSIAGRKIKTAVRRRK
ncbi:nuclear pore complex protein Nup153 isoform X2 [Rhinichthys klamathensis goyatoka]|uniref:nuclear pore complex protein Nup153 isoform X2 n=1 Tax=Rhinichthys klamathensis goyatoka TaxID=3034132 RepID=UPI0024B5CDAC|nr:nuclear pore complex protein Nup153 isoform X2 [Rhinichthys klamathensis goyatoka]